jgi:signal transduction histidine kinase
MLGFQPLTRGSEGETNSERPRGQATALEAIFCAHADCLIIYGPDGELERMNPAAREMFGVDEGANVDYRELVKSLVMLDGQGEPFEFEQLPSRRALRGELVKGVVIALHNARGRVWYSSSAAPLRAPDGAIVGAVVSSVEITHLRRLQEEREQTIRALTHEARTRLNVIQTHGELLCGTAATSGDGSARRRAEVMVSNVRQLAGIIDALVGDR